MSKLQFNYDRKQLPQIIGLGVLSTGMFGWFTLKLVTPPPAERAQAEGVIARAAIKPQPSAADLAMAALTNGVPPSDTMQDPFVPQMSMTSTNIATTAAPPTASLPAPVPNWNPVQPMPFSGAIRPLTPMNPGDVAAAPAPAPVPWNVTGVLVGPGNGNRIAILRSGDARRFVALGEMVDDRYRLIGIDRFGVTLSQGASRYRLMLGADKPSSPSVSAPQPTTVSDTTNLTQGTAVAPAIDQSAEAPAASPNALVAPASEESSPIAASTTPF